MTNPLLAWAERLENPGCWMSSGWGLRDWCNDVQIVSHWSYTPMGLLCDEFIKANPTVAKWDGDNFDWGGTKITHEMPLCVKEWVMAHPKGELVVKLAQAYQGATEVKALADFLRWLDKDATNAPDYVMRRAKEIMEAQGKD